MRYFKPREDLSGNKKWRYTTRDGIPCWMVSYCDADDLERLKKNFVEVKTEAEAIS